jgi:hypothetical protein
MPLNERQDKLALEFLRRTYAEEGIPEEQLTNFLSSADDAKFNKIMEEAFADAAKERLGTPSLLETAATGFTESFSGSASRDIEARNLSRPTDLEFKDGKPSLKAEVPYETALADAEDRIELNRITNPKTFTLFNLSGYLTGLSSMATSIGKAGAKAAGLAGTKALAVEGGSAMAIQSTAERLNRGEEVGTLGQAAEVAFGAAGGPLVGGAVKFAAKAPAFIANKSLGAFAAASKQYSKILRKDVSKIDDIVENAPKILEILKDGGEAAGKRLADTKVAKGAAIKATRQSVREQSDEILGKVANHLDELKASVEVPQQEFTQTASEVSEFLGKGLDDFARGIVEVAETSQQIASEELQIAFTGLRAMGLTARANVTSQYGKAIEVVEALGRDLKLDAAPEMGQFLSTLRDNGFVKQIGRKWSYVGPKLDVTEMTALDKLMKFRGGNFKELNEMKKVLGNSIDWDSGEPVQRAMKDLYTGLRTKLAESAKSLNSPVDVDRLFGEYQGALQVASKFTKAMQRDDAGLITPKALRTLAAEAEATLSGGVRGTAKFGEGRRFTVLRPVDDIAAKALNKVIRLRVRDMRLSKYVDYNEVHRKLSSVMNSADPALAIRQIEQVTGKLKGRAEYFRALDNMGLPKEAISAIKAGGATYKRFISELPPELSELKGTFQALHDKVQKALRVNGYAKTEIFEALKNSDAMDPTKLDDLQQIMSLKPELYKMLETQKLGELAREMFDKDIGAQQKLMGLAKSVAREGEKSLEQVVAELGAKAGAGAAGLAVGGPALAALSVVMVHLHKALASPAKAALFAERFKLVPPAKAAEWGRTTALMINRILPSVRSQGGLEPITEPLEQ